MDPLQRRMASAQLESCNFGGAEHAGQNIVEVMRDAAGESTEGIHFLGLTQLILELVFGGDVLGDACDAINATLGIFDGKSAVVNPPDRPVGTHNAILEIVPARDLEGMRCRVHPDAIVEMDAV